MVDIIIVKGYGYGQCWLGLVVDVVNRGWERVRPMREGLCRRAALDGGRWGGMSLNGNSVLSSHSLVLEEGWANQYQRRPAGWARPSPKGGGVLGASA